jgi:hypothetical protein
MSYLKVLSQHSFILTEERHEKSVTMAGTVEELKSEYRPSNGQHRNHPGMNNRPVEAAVLRRQSYTIIANLPPY